MTKVTIQKNKDRVIGFVIEGHSGFANLGEDIVCASISILAYTAINSLNAVAQIDKDDIDYRIDQELGYLKVAVHNSNDKAQVIFDTFIVGIQMLAEDYKDYVTLIKWFCVCAVTQNLKNTTA